MELRALLDRMDDDRFRLEAGDFVREQAITTFDGLIELITTSEDGQVVRQGYRVFSLVRADDETYLDALRHPHHGIRRAAASMFRGETALKHAATLLPVLADEDHYVQREALWAFGTMGPDVLPLLQETRRTAKGALRRGALIGIAEVAGPDAFSPEDREVVDRFVRFKLEDDLYSVDEMHLCGGWYAIKTENQAAVLEVCGLREPVPVTKVLGAQAWNNDHHAWTKDDEHVRCARVYVTGSWDGWTLVFGEPFEHATRPVTEICAVLSAVFGEAHYYGMSCGDGWTAWCVAEQGEIVRYYDAFKPDDQVGELDVEDGRGLPHDTSDENDDLDDIWATEIAEELSVNPGYFEGDVEGHGVLALTECGRTHGSPKGYLQVIS
ncbi:HEAT repeat domain-containing protein [Lentzea sp. NBC_00516]|uniref:HEAT repeat domain-containing protein n=1 Tax=Lentzea sp. NBC_00516 TaxID=2903582 RepID=UPI002E809965|nr:HEAT repeat domain-containing protein [Lentzea sp. NBC_00516]WUD29161.1 HEAT repeat domain-containing protein [Lentzea sp. NBC_00516]